MIFCRFAVGLLLATVSLNGYIEDFFKKPTQKGDIHSMRNIDFIYTINLDQRPEKFASCCEQLARFGIYPYRFSAVNGWTLSLEAINGLGVKYALGMKSDIMGTSYLVEEGGQPCHEMICTFDRNYFCHCMSRGAIGIVLSHLSVLQDAYDSGYETIWVMEDDIEVMQDPHEISNLIDKLDKHVGKKKWDVLFTDRDTKNQQGVYVECNGFAYRPNFVPKNPERFAMKYLVSSDFRKIGARYGAYSMIVRRSGMKKILDFFKKYQIFLPYDMDFFQIADIHLYTVNSDVVSTQVKAISDNGSPPPNL